MLVPPIRKCFLLGGVAAAAICGAATIGDPSLTVGAFAGVLGWLVNLSANQAHDFLKSLLQDPPEAGPIFRNNHVRTLLALAVRVVAEHVAARLKAQHGEISKGLRDAPAKLQERFGAELDQPGSPFAQVGEFQVTEVLNEFVHLQGDVDLLTADDWARFVDEAGLDVSELEREALVSALHRRELGKAIWGIVKDDAQKGGQGFAAIELLYLSKILSAVEQQPAGTPPDVTPMVERVNVLFERADQRTRKYLAPLLTDVAAVRTTLAEFYRSYRDDRQQDAAFRDDVRAGLRSTERQIRSEARYVVDEVISHIDERNDAERREREQRPQPPPLPNRRRALQPVRPSLWARLFGWGRDKTKNRGRMLALVRTYQIEGILHEAIRETNQIQVDWKLAPDAVVKHADLDGLLVSTGASFEKIFERLVDRPVLILGAPGSGKSILLLQLTEVLLEAAEQDSSRPIPVMLNLSSWATARLPLEEWLIHESHLSYLVPERLVRRWCEENMICPLLDGLDEVAPEHRRACLDAIELWRIQHPARAMAVCSRTEDYEALHAKFSLPTAIQLLPLSDEQVDPVLARESMAGLRALLQKETWFRDDLRTVLFLSFAAFAYADMEESTLRLPTEADEASQRKARLKHLYDSYVTRRFAQSRLDRQLPESELRRFLGWLAFQMESRKHSRFHLENLQMDWISTSSGRCWFSFLSQFFFALVVLLPVAITIRLIPLSNSPDGTLSPASQVIMIALIVIWVGSLAGVTSAIRQWTDVVRSLSWKERLRQGALLMMSCVCLLATIIGTLRWISARNMLKIWITFVSPTLPLNNPSFQSLVQEWGEPSHLPLAAEITSGTWMATLGVLTIAVMIFLLPRRVRNHQIACFALCALMMNGAVITYNKWDQSKAIWYNLVTILGAIFIGVLTMIPAAYFGMLGTKVTVGATKWRISLGGVVGFAVPLFLVLLPAFVLGQDEGQNRIELSALWAALVVAIGGGLLGGIITGIQRNQGMLAGGELHTARPNEAVMNALRGAVWFTLATVIATSSVIFALALWGVPMDAPRPEALYSIGEQLRLAISFGLVVGCCVLALFSGIDIPLKHYVLRGVLRLTDQVPLQLIHPLIAGCRKNLLRSAGGGFEFGHRTLREHFAETEHARRSQQAVGNVSWLRTRWGTLCVLILLLFPIAWYPISRTLNPAHRLTDKAQLLWDQENYAEAEKYSRQALALNESRYGKDHYFTAASKALVGQTLYMQDHFSDADPFLREALAIARQKLLPDDPYLAQILSYYTRNLHFWSDETQSPELYNEAKAGYREIIQRTKDNYIVPFPATAKPMNQLIGLLLNRNEIPEAEQVARELVDLQKTVRKAPHVEIAEAKRTLAACLALQKRYDEAKPIVEEALDEALRSAGKNSATTARSYYWLARIQEEKGEAAQALVNAEQALASSKLTFKAGDRRLKEAEDLVARLRR
ncbi:MAG TPA: tetratricopeptide repeat protein [Chthoniobacterales bacterium]|nr:tetratricopeptide repeat protein [Chthoniobacterales bacterium]